MAAVAEIFSFENARLVDYGAGVCYISRCKVKHWSIVQHDYTRVKQTTLLARAFFHTVLLAVPLQSSNLVRSKLHLWVRSCFSTMITPFTRVWRTKPYYAIHIRFTFKHYIRIVSKFLQNTYLVPVYSFSDDSTVPRAPARATVHNGGSQATRCARGLRSTYICGLSLWFTECHISNFCIQNKKYIFPYTEMGKENLTVICNYGCSRGRNLHLM